MCGIAGHISFSAPVSRNFVAQMVHRIRHRGPNDEGLWSSTRGECTLGHARLSIIDLSPLGHQPMVDPTTGNSIVFNGEIYNFQSLRKQCEAAGDSFKSHSDTEVILALYRRYGERCIDKLRGMFAFAIWDESRRSVFFARDRVGKKPFNYALVDGAFVFCSEIDPLARHPLVSQEMDNEALEFYLQCQYIPAPWTIYKQIRKLPPAHFGVLDREGLKIKQYWDVSYKSKLAISEEDAIDGLEERLTEAVRLRMVSDVPLGALLSGGVDSSLIVALMAKLSGEQVSTFSIGFREEAFNELPFARQVAELCGTSHYPEIVEENVAELLPLIARHYGEPFADSSAVPSFLVSQAARRHVTVAMNGDGGDELLGGYPRYSLSGIKMCVASVMPDAFSPSTLSALATRLAPVSNIPSRVIRKLLTEFAWPELRSINMYSGSWDDRLRFSLMKLNQASKLLPTWRAQWLAGAKEHADNAIDRMLWHDNRTYLPGDLLTKMDIASMHCGLETRSPFLDHEVIEYCAALPARHKVNGGITKYLIKKLTERYFPREFVHRKKMGFAIPVADWLRGPLRPLLEDTLRNKDLMAPLDQSVIVQTLDQFLNQNIGSSPRLWTLLMYGVWRRHAIGAGL